MLDRNEANIGLDRGSSARPEGEGVERASAERGSSPRPSTRQTSATAETITSTESGVPFVPADGDELREMPEMIHACVGVELIRPLGADWREVRPYLRDVGHMAARAANAGMRALVMLEDDKVAGAPATLLRRRLVSAMDAERVSAQAKLAKPSTRKEIRAKLARMAELRLGSNVVDGLGAVVFARWSTDRKSLLACDVSVPSFKRSMAIPIRDRGWSIERDDRGLVLSVKLAEGRGAAHCFAVVASGGSAQAVIRRILSGEYERGDCKLKYDERRSKWVARLAYAFPAPPKRLESDRVLAVHLGVRNFLTWADSDGKTGVVDAGGDVVAFKGQMLRRRSLMKSKIRSAGKGSRGHGRTRLYRGYAALDDAEARWMDTKCKQVAAVVAKLAEKSNSGRVAIEDWSPRDLASELEHDGEEHVARLIRRFPFYKLRSCIEWACKRAGIEIESVESFYDSTTCPKCGNVDAKQDDGRGTFRCSNVECAIKRSVDGVAAWNLHRKTVRDGGSFKKHERRVEELRADLLGLAAETGSTRNEDEKTTKKPRRRRAGAVDEVKR